MSYYVDELSIRSLLESSYPLFSYNPLAHSGEPNPRTSTEPVSYCVNVEILESLAIFIHYDLDELRKPKDLSKL